MSTPATPSNPQSAGDDRNLVPAPVTFEDTMHRIWQRNRLMVLGLCALILLLLLAKGGWEAMQRKQEREIGANYAAAKTPEQLKAFADANADHQLAGVAQLQIADEAYTAGKYAEAETAYAKARSVLQEGPFADRARLGLAVTKVQAGKASEGQAELKQIAGDANLFNALRVEAAYHLVSLAAEAGDAAQVQTYFEQLMQIDPSSPWTQRAMMLRASLPVAPVTAAAAIAPTPAPGIAPTQESASESMQIKLPGK